MTANEYQVSGDHYNRDYQHWDFVCDNEMHYLPACATKYISRWRSKNGVEDLKKAKHYLAKTREMEIFPTVNDESLDRFCEQFHVEDSAVIAAICDGDWGLTDVLLDDLIEAIELGPTSSYITGGAE